MTKYKLSRKQFLPITKYRAWDFFSSPRNLTLLTPRRIDVKVRDISGGERIYNGQLVNYRFFALPLVRVSWETVVTDVKHHECFTHRQLKGPYAFWIHRISFKTVPGGIEIEDDVEYALPFGWIGHLSGFLAKRELEKVFDYRANVLREYFAIDKADRHNMTPPESVSSSGPVALSS